MKIISKIKIHPFFYIVLFITFITGHFKEFIYLIFIILFHELGHILGAIYYKWNISKIVILPFGGITIFNEKINKPLKEQFIITILGPIFQIILSFFITNQNIYNYHLILLIFNLLPIIPLDGSKLLNIILNKIFPFRISKIISIVISFVAIILILTIKLSLINILILLFLIIKNIKEIIDYKYLINKFILERYTYNFNFNKRKIINNYKNMYMEHYHIIFINNHYYTEKEVLKNIYN